MSDALPSTDGQAEVGRPGFLILRAFLGQFWVLQFYGKLHDAKAGTTALENLGQWSANLTADFAKSTPLPEFLLVPYTRAAPWIELGLGLLILVGYRTRWALLGAAAFLVSLDIGLMLSGDADSVKSNTLILLALLLAAQWERWNAWSIDQWLARRAGR
jgi:thiosulfate dehydrogenase [quinone] large subunit